MKTLKLIILLAFVLFLAGCGSNLETPGAICYKACANEDDSMILDEQMTDDFVMCMDNCGRTIQAGVDINKKMGY